MKRASLLLVSLCFLLNTSTIHAQTEYTPSPEVLKTRDWFRDARFGMFIHWGASSILGDGEWVMNNRNIHVKDYTHLKDVFNPLEFDAKKWVSLAKNAGMKYITFVSRHHDSFSNWDTKHSNWKVTATPFKRDVLKELAEECKAQNIKLFLYYSTLDWYRNDYQYWTGRTGQGTGRSERGNWADYIQFMKNQLTELLTNYGEIGGIWLDGHWDQTAPEGEKDRSSRVNWHYDEIYGLIHRLQPHCLIGNNHHMTPFPGEDFQMFERDLPGENKAGLSFQEASKNLPLETCETISASWGYNITDRKYKSTHELIKLLVNAAGLNTNLLLNVGPLPSGAVQQEFSDRLDSVGKWMNKYSSTIYNTRGGFIKPQSWGAITEKDKEIFIHVLNKGTTSLTIENFPYKAGKLFAMDSNKPLKYKAANGQITIDLAGVKRDEFDTVLRLEIKRRPEMTTKI